MHANLPKIAKEWERKYNKGGRVNMANGGAMKRTKKMARGGKR